MCNISGGYLREEGVIILGKEFFKPIDRHNCNKRASITSKDIEKIENNRKGGRNGNGNSRNNTKNKN